MASTHSDIAARLDRFTEACRERGMPVTHQRLAVFRALLESESHPDADAIHKSLREAYPTLSLGTVYKTLEMLVGLGLVREVGAPGSRKRFDANRHPHHHLWCTHCHRLRDVELDGAAAVDLPKGLDFTVTDVTVQFNGICSDCRAAGATTQNTTGGVR